MQPAGTIAGTAPIERLRIGAFRVPTDAPESDGTLAWTATTLIVVEIDAGGHTGLGYTYGADAVAELLRQQLGPVLLAHDAFAVGALWREAFAQLRNLGRQGCTAMAVSAVDVALWDLKARCLGVPLVALLGPVRAEISAYGSGGFTSYSDAQLREQFSQWADRGIRQFKMKVGREPERDPSRVRAARDAIGPEAALFVDANSAYTRGQAVAFAERFAGEFDVRWLEQPLAPGDLAGLRFLRARLPGKLDLAEGEYGYDLDYFRRLLEAEAADVVMPDLTRCGGITGFLKISALCEAWHVPMSTHCAPALHVPVACAVPDVRHLEYFHDHARIEQLLFDGAREPENGTLQPDLSQPGHGLQFKWQDARPYAA